MDTKHLYTAFTGDTLFYSGNLKTLLEKLKTYLDSGGNEDILVFDEETGLAVDFNMQGTLQEVWDRVLPDEQPKAPGRPRLGVVCREVSLLPRHWEWLDRQQLNASGTIRRLVEAAMKGNPVREVQLAADRIMTVLAGNREGFEEANRALYAGNWESFTDLIKAWPADIRLYLQKITETLRNRELQHR